MTEDSAAALSILLGLIASKHSEEYTENQLVDAACGMAWRLNEIMEGRDPDKSY